MQKKLDLELKCPDCNDSFSELPCVNSSGQAICQDCGDDYFQCDDCAAIKYEDDIHTVDDYVYCGYCFVARFTDCASCGETIARDNSYYYTDEAYCETCWWDNFGTCSSCGEYYPNDEFYYDEDNDQYLCPDCQERPRRRNGRFRFIESASFKLTNGITRKYGVEIETVTDSIVAEASRFNFIAGGDASIDCGASAGIEYRSHILQGDSGIQSIEKMCNELQVKKHWVNQSCGLHVHIDATDLSDKEFINLSLLAHVYDRIIFKIVKAGRMNGQYCLELDLSSYFPNLDYEEILKYSPRRLYGNSRYRGFNVQSFWEHGTFEFRYHHGTIDFKDIKNWILFCLCFVEYGRQFNAPKYEKAYEYDKKNLFKLYKAIKLPRPQKRHFSKIYKNY